MITQNKSLRFQKNRNHIGLPEVQVYYKVQAPESQRLTGWITETEYQEIKLLRESNGSPPLRVLERARAYRNVSIDGRARSE